MNDGFNPRTKLPSTDEVHLRASIDLLMKHGIDQAHLSSVLTLAMGEGGSFADVYLKGTIAESWGLEGGAVRSGSYRCDEGFGIRVLRDEEAIFASSQVIDVESLRRVAGQVRSAVGGSQPGRAVALPVASSRARRSLYETDPPLGMLEAADKIALLQRVDRFARARDTRVTEVNANLTATHETVWVARCDGLHAGDVRPLLSLSVLVRVKSGTHVEAARAGIGGRYHALSWSDEELSAFVNRLVDAALVKLDSRPAPAGTMSVVVGPGWNGVLLHEAVGHGLEADGIRRGTSAFAGRVGERVAPEDVSIVDDGTLTGQRGSLNIDDEGCPTQRTMLIENGVLRGFMQDSLSARIMGQQATGNGRREGYAVLPMPRMTNTFMLNGNRDPEEIVASVKYGIYVAGLEGGQVDITSGQFVFAATEAYLIENGRITAPIKGATITGNGPETIQRISLVGNDLALDTGMATCGKAGQTVPVGVGQPTLRVDEMTVGGTA